MDVEDILARADRLCLEAARERGSLVAIVCNGGGGQDEDEGARDRHFKAMVHAGLLMDGLLVHLSVRRARSGRQGAERVAEYMPTSMGLRLLAAVEEIERLRGRLVP